MTFIGFTIAAFENLFPHVAVFGRIVVDAPFEDCGLLLLEADSLLLASFGLDSATKNQVILN